MVGRKEGSQLVGIGLAGRAAGSQRWLRRTSWFLSGAVLVALVATAVVRRSEVADALRLIADVNPLVLAAGAVCEAVSLLCFAGVWRWLLNAGGAYWPLRRATALTLGANAIAGALPAGPYWPPPGPTGSCAVEGSPPNLRRRSWPSPGPCPPSPSALS